MKTFSNQNIFLPSCPSHSINFVDRKNVQFGIITISIVHGVTFFQIFKSVTLVKLYLSEEKAIS